jgi:hypothetical protein
MDDEFSFSIDMFSIFGNRLWVRGWAFTTLPVNSLQLVIPGGQGITDISLPMKSYGQIPSPDVEQHLNRRDARSVRFEEAFDIVLRMSSLAAPGWRSVMQAETRG